MVVDFLMVFITLGSVGCNCVTPKSIADVIDRAEIIFEGTVAKAEKSTINLIFDVGRITYTENKVLFIIDSLVMSKRSDIADSIEILFYENRDECDGVPPDFIFGERYLISAISCSERRALLCNNSCSLREKIVKKDILAEEPLPTKTDKIKTDSNADSKKIDAKKRKRIWYKRILFLK